MILRNGRKLITGVLIFALSASLYANISNGSFEIDDGNGWVDGWSRDSFSIMRENESTDGYYGLYFTEPFISGNISTSISQSGITILPGEDIFKIDFKPLFEGPPGESDYLKLKLFASGSLLYETTIWSNAAAYSSDAYITDIGNFWYQASVNISSYAATVDQIAIEMDFLVSETDLLGDIYIDNIQLTAAAVPAPGATGLSVIGITLVGLFRRLKRG